MDLFMMNRFGVGMCVLCAVSGTVHAGGTIYNDASIVLASTIPGGYARFADLNGDGTQDFVAGYGGSQNDFRIAMGVGDGTAGAATTYTITAGDDSMVQDVIPCDLDGDGDIDLVALVQVVEFGMFDAFQEAHLQAYENDGTGSFTTLGSLTSASPSSFAGGLEYLARLGDFDGDGSRDDIAVVDNDNRVLRVFSWSGGWSQISTSGLPTGGIEDLVALDFDGDGSDDLALAYRAFDLVSVRRNTGGFTQVRTLSTSSDPDFIEVGDFDGDMMPDLLVFVGSEVTMFPNGGDDFAGSGSSTGLGSPGGTSAFILDRMAVGDINDDGFDDFVFERINSNDNKDVYLNDTKGAFTLVESPTFDGRSLSLVDLNNDGMLDLVGCTNGGSPRVLLNELAGSCSADLTNDGDLNFLDVSLFLSEMVDFNEDMSFNFLDVSAFLSAFSMGCP